MVAANSAVAAGTDPAAGEMSTFGWDTVFAVRIENVNAAIAARHVSPAGFRHTDPDDPNVFCAGQFGDWEIVRGGDGDGVNVRLPLRDITGASKGTTGYSSYRCAQAALVVTVRLHFVETADGPSKQHLTVRPTAVSTDVPVVQTYSADFTQAPVNPPFAVYAIQAAVISWCTDNLAEFGYVFAVADLADEADTGAWSFLKPNQVSYAYVDGPDDADAYLGVLAVTGSTDTGKLQQVLDTRVVAAGEEGAFVISRQLLLRDLILPNLGTLWTDFTPNKAVFTDNALALAANTTVTLPATDYQGTTYHPVLKEFSFTCEGEQITVAAYTETVTQEGVTAWCRTTARYTIVRGTNSSGQVTLAYQQLGDPTVSHGHYIDESVEITDIILGIVLGVALAVVVVLTGGAAAVVIAIVGALVVGLISLSPQIAGLVEDGDAPAIDMLQDNIYAPMVWTDSRDFTVSSVTLDGSLRLGGSLGFATT